MSNRGDIASRGYPLGAVQAVTRWVFPGGVVLALACVMGCQEGIIGDEARTSVDARPPASVDASIDRTIDAATTPDAALPDTSPPSCDELYGEAPEYILCAEEAATCTFNARTDGGTCNEMCALYGGTCIRAHDNESTPGTECVANLPAGDDCNTPRSTEICVCSRP